MDILLCNLKRLPFSTTLAAHKYGMDNIRVPANARLGSKLCMAVLRGDNTEVKELIARGADINSRDEPDGWTPLLYSIYYNNQRALQFLLDQGADIEKEDYANRTPAMFAAIRGDCTLLAELIIRGADIHRRDIRGKNALDFAREYHQQKCIELLEQYNK